MKKIKLLLFAVLCSFLFIGTASAKDKVKVYVFEAGGCPYCEAEIEYLKKLDSYNKKFEIVQKELYVDHVDWEEGKDYDLGVKVAEAFLKKGYSNASYQGTPFVVISNVYAAASYSESLESIINKAYEDGDADIVGCFIDDNEGCADKIVESTEIPETTNESDNTETTGTKSKESDNSSTTTAICIAVIGSVICSLGIIRSKNKTVE